MVAIKQKIQRSDLIAVIFYDIIDFLTHNGT